MPHCLPLPADQNPFIIQLFPLKSPTKSFHLNMELIDARFKRMVSLLKRNDPIINTINASSIAMSESMVSELVNAVNQNSFVARIILQANQLSAASIAQIFDLLGSNPKLISLDMSENGIGDDALAYLSSVLQRLPMNRDPISLVLRRNVFGPVGAGHLAKALAQNVPIRWLDLRNNQAVSDQGVEQLALSLAQNTVLVGIDLIKCGCNELGTAALADALVENSTLATLLLQDALSVRAVHSLAFLLSDSACHLTGLYLWHCQLGTDDRIETLCRSLRGNQTINTLGLSYNEIDDLGGIHISDMVSRNHAILKLHLGANNFRLATAGFFGVALGQNSTLQYLDLSRNFLSSHGVWALAVALRGNHSLRSIDLRHNEVDSEGAEMLCELIAGNSAIVTMRLSGNHFGDNAIAGIAQKLQTNKTLKEIELNEVQLTSTGFIALCTALENNSTLEKLSVSENRIGAEAMVAFARLLQHNRALACVTLKECGIGNIGCQHIAGGLALNATLTELDLRRNDIGSDGIALVLEALTGNYSMMKIQSEDNPFMEKSDAREIMSKMTDLLERNSYYLHNLLMRDMASLVADSALF
jgi:Ran GTPase-activating protein (RanGAP) involved in mRNA processing and transport